MIRDPFAAGKPRSCRARKSGTAGEGSAAAWRRRNSDPGERAAREAVVVRRRRLFAVLITTVAVSLRAQGPLPGTALLEAEGDLSAQMVAGIGRFLEGELARAPDGRAAFWHADVSSAAAYEKSDWFTRQNQSAARSIGVVGWGEGGLLAMYSAALDPRIESALVSGYFGPREQLWREPIYRNVFGLVKEFGDAGIARLIVPRTLLVEYAAAPQVDGPPPVRDGRSGAAPGRIETPRFDDVRREVEQARQSAGGLGSAIKLYQGKPNAVTGPVAEETLLAFLRRLNPAVSDLSPPTPALADLRQGVDLDRRQERLVRGMELHTQRLLQRAHWERDEFLWKKVQPTTPEAWREAMRPYREKYWNEVIGRFPPSTIPPRPRSRLLKEQPTWTGYEVVVDVFPEVFAWGYLLLPKGIKPGEKRPVVVTQHGLNGVPESVINEDPNSRMYRAYKAYAVRLVERGFVVFAPHNPYNGDDLFRVLQRKANPLGKSLFGIIAAQHDRMLDWLSREPMVDPARIGFYGLSYGGNAAMVLPAILDHRYALTINSGCFNDWIWKTTSIDWRNTYMYSREYEKPDFNLGMTFGDAEIAALIAPRPFMVERGHDDGVGLDEFVAFEYARVKRLYDRLRIPERTEFEYFNGPHTIHGVGTFKFLHRQLQWPEPTP